MTERLSSLFDGVAFKRLRATEVDPETSHGHEFQGVQSIRSILGTAKRVLPATFLYLGDGTDPIVQTGELTWYNARTNQGHRSAEYRLYYSAEVGLVQELAQPDDLVVVAVRKDGQAFVVIAEHGSSWDHQVRWLFTLPAETRDSFQSEGDTSIDRRELNLAARLVLESLDLEAPPPECGLDGDHLLSTFPDGFPTTRKMSEYVHSVVGDVNPREDPDQALIRWIETEEQAFSILEQRDWDAIRTVPEHIGTLDSFLDLSKRFINRRKSRAGAAFENHLEQVFRACKVRFSRGMVTENKKRPDFLFPSADDYRNELFPAARLTVLGAKISCRDRWRQVVTEATRVRHKHLATLEPAISEGQTSEMRSADVQLVVPNPIKASYSQAQQAWLLTLREFVDHVRDLEGT